MPPVEVCPSGFVTVIFAMAPVVARLVGTTALSADELMYVVVSALAFQLTTACDWKLLPVTESVNAGEPAGTLDGETLAMAGAGDVVPPLELPDPPEQPETASNVKESTKKT